ncbi:hypothetical protein D9O36_19780 [Zobellia amurskyensis]|uniref:Uncharacterized protein n=1 Tax=Zobellia amurskyensis TaxID=248905 RepID=A0A7X2ZXF2_9FLAO|nr:hypothetical protein [Zobellia amurskyensis]MUH38099.1 hypothetical protein [Zobellia amurskyensis]
MNNKVIFGLKVFRKLYSKVFGADSLVQLDCEQDADIASQIIYDELQKEKPSMIARFGATEMNVMINYLGVNGEDKDWIKYIRNKSLPWWWEENRMQQMQRWSGFFPPTETKIQQFCELMQQDIREVDVLGSWIPEESYYKDEIRNAQKVKLVLLEPYTSQKPWSRALKGKKVLVVHPFAELIEEQYKKRESLFDNPEVLPEFELQTLPAVQSLGGESNGFTDWFDALQWMKDEIDKRDYDICLIGAGAYGFPLAAHVKRQGKKAIHIGGALQLLFGIKGNRWEATDYATKWGVPDNLYLDFFKNENWIRPTDKQKPANADKVEDACYW